MRTLDEIADTAMRDDIRIATLALDFAAWPRAARARDRPIDPAGFAD
jgi:hypothetical protein